MWIIIKMTNGKYYGSPTPAIHNDRATAVEEQIRLANKFPGDQFILCKLEEGITSQPVVSLIRTPY